MLFNQQLLNKNQDYINFWNAYAAMFELKMFINYFSLYDHEKLKDSVDHIYKREFADEKTLVDNYLIRSRIVKEATECCELLCKAILVANGKTWNEMKSLGHNLIDCYDSLPENQKTMLENAPIWRIMNDTALVLNSLVVPLSETDNQNLEAIDIRSRLLSFDTKPILPNIKARYPGEDMVDYDEKFIVGYTKLLYLLSIQEYTSTDIFIESMQLETDKLR